MRFFGWLLLLCALLVNGSSAQAQMPGIKIFVHANLEAESTTPAPGETVTLALTMRPDTGWHGYWQNPGDAGVGLVLDWKLPPGVTAGQPRFPVPDTLIISGFMNYIYKAPHAILVDVKIAPDVVPGTKIPVRADAQWLACTDRVCVPQRGSLAVDLVAGISSIDAGKRAQFDAWRAELPVPLDREALYAANGRVIQIAIPFPANAKLAEPYLFPVTLELFDYVAPQKLRRVGDWLVIETQLSAQQSGLRPQTIEGLLRIGKGQGLLIKAKAGAVPAGGSPVALGDDEPTIIATPPLYWLLLSAFAGGLILNIMPCVFPILGLKAIALAKAGGDEATARSEALAYTAGAVLSCVALGGLMLALRALGQEVGWAFQLQEPIVVLLLLVLMVGITANLAGLFEIGTFAVFGRATTNGTSGSFLTGALAAFVATPCTGPFMAAALGAALLLPVGPALLLFAMLGLGLALPFLALAYIPALRSRLPRPGPWMATFRKSMAIPMGLTALALLWLLWRVAGTGVGVLGVAAIFSFLLLTGMIGRLRPADAGRMALLIGLSLAAVGAIALPYLVSSDSRPASSILPSKEFSPVKLSALRAKGTPVFVYFTADWCVTCKINEAAVLETADTLKLFTDKNIAVLRGDFTRHDPAIARFLYEQQAVGVPLYLYYPKGTEGRKLPQLLTAATLADAIAQ